MTPDIYTPQHDVRPHAFGLGQLRVAGTTAERVALQDGPHYEGAWGIEGETHPDSLDRDRDARRWLELMLARLPTWRAQGLVVDEQPIARRLLPVTRFPWDRALWWDHDLQAATYPVGLHAPSWRSHSPEAWRKSFDDVETWHWESGPGKPFESLRLVLRDVGPAYAPTDPWGEPEPTLPWVDGATDEASLAWVLSWFRDLEAWKERRALLAARDNLERAPLTASLGSLDLAASLLTLDPEREGSVNEFFEAFGGPPELYSSDRWIIPGIDAREYPWLSVRRLRDLRDSFARAGQAGRLHAWRPEPDPEAAGDDGAPLGTVVMQGNELVIRADLWQQAVMSGLRVEPSAWAWCVAPRSSGEGGVCGRSFIRRKADHKYCGSDCGHRVAESRYHRRRHAAWDAAGRPGPFKKWRRGPVTSSSS